MKARSKRPRVESSKGDASWPPPSGDPSTEEFVDLTAAVVFGDAFQFYGLYMMLGGNTMFYVSCFTCDTLGIDLYYEVIHGICLLFFVL